MQLHSLSFGALGSFAGEHVIDFDALGGSALFLIDGPTGAGKSTIIDAIAFALYGSVAGQATDRQRLRSDHAAPESPSYAELDFSTSFGRFRVRRTPEFERAKRRGTGTTTAHASVSLLRSVGPQGWEPVSQRAGEVDAEIARVVGLTRAQFLQTVVLPQGEFAAFLSADSKDRLAVLERIFATDLYSRIEDQLDIERRGALEAREAAEQAVQVAVRHVTSRLSDDDAISIDASSDTLDEDLHSLVESMRTRMASQQVAVAACEDADARVAERVGELEAAAAAHARLRQADASLVAAQLEEDQARAAVDARALAELGVHRPLDDAGFAEAALAAIDRTVGGLDAARREEEQLPRDRAEADRAERRLAELQQRIAQAEAERDVVLPGRLNELATALERHAVQAEAQATATVLHEAALVQARLDGMAAELADSLDDGRPCPVCGATQHPEPAPHRGDPVTAEAATEAADARERAVARRQQVEVERAALRGLHPGAGSTVAEPAGDPATPLPSLAEIGSQAQEVRERATHLGDEVHQGRTELAAAGERLEGLRRTIAERASRVAESTHGHPSVADRLAALGGLRDAVVALGQAAAAVQACHEARAQAQAEAGALLPARRPSLADRSGIDDATAVDVALGEQRAAREVTTSELRAAVSARDATAGLLDDLQQRVEMVQAARSERQACWMETADVIAVASLVRGSTGNRLAQPLSAYVVQTMFDEILEAANRRLRTMLDGRFELQSTEERTSRRLTGQGLGLQVLDLRTDTVRRTSTLSGGETFCASLALALGLADTVRAHAGGIDIGMLLIDEGFGSLDGERLDEVMAELLRLRADGRTVGVISHVAEMKRSILERIDVRPLGGRNGSTLEVSWMS